jgi:acyl carrier protein
VSAITAGSVRVGAGSPRRRPERAGRPETVSDDTDFFAERLIDSFGLLDLIVALEERWSHDRLESIEADDFTMVGPSAAGVEELTRAWPLAACFGALACTSAIRLRAVPGPTSAATR